MSDGALDPGSLVVPLVPFFGLLTGPDLLKDLVFGAWSEGEAAPGQGRGAVFSQGGGCAVPFGELDPGDRRSPMAAGRVPGRAATPAGADGVLVWTRGGEWRCGFHGSMSAGR